jgi:tetratricopeptide (TPR) repeat protein
MVRGAKASAARRFCSVGLLLALAGAPAAAAQSDPQTALLERDGWALVAAGNASAAAEAFRRALAAEPKSARLHLGAGTAAFLARRDADARDEAARALALDGSLTPALALLGQASYRLGDTAGAVQAFESLVAAAPDDRAAAATLERWRREIDLHGRMRQAVSDHFTIAFEGPAEEALAHAALDSLDRAYWRIGAILGTYPSDPITVVLYTAEQFRDVTRSPAWAAGAYDGTIRLPVRGALEAPRELDRVLAHELAHAFVRTLAPRGVPVWLDEGIATALETGEPGEWEKAVADRHAAVPLGQLQRSFGGLSGNDAHLAYATSALAARRLIAEAGGAAVANLLRDLGEGAEFRAAFLRRTQRTFDDFQHDLRQ